MELNRETVRNSTITKLERYGWTVRDKEGVYKKIHKGELLVDDSYQRGDENKIEAMTKNWSWLACGALTVAHRPDDSHFVIDGRQRRGAALRRSDIGTLPCMVYEVESVSEEAKGFLAANSFRKPVSAIGKFKAKVMTGDQIAIAVRGLIDAAGYEISKAEGRGKIRCIAAMERCYAAEPEALANAWDLCVRLSNGETIADRLLQGVWYLFKEYEPSIAHGSLKARVLGLGAKKLLDGANEAAAYYASGGAKVWAEGMAKVINHKARANKIKRRSVDD